jgi:hypothetical protein
MDCTFCQVIQGNSKISSFLKNMSGITTQLGPKAHINDLKTLSKKLSEIA